MKILGVSTSPVKRNNDEIVDYCLTVAAGNGCEVEKISFSSTKVSPCIDCNHCKDKPECSIKDDMTEIYSKMRACDGIIVSSPVYFGSVSAQCKAMFDRTRVLRRDKFALKDKVGIGVAIGASRNGGQEFTIQAIHSWMHIQGMIVVGDNSHFGGAVVRPFSDDSVGKKTCEDSVVKMVGLLKKIN